MPREKHKTAIMNRLWAFGILAVLLLIGEEAMSQSVLHVRPAAVAGQFYASGSAELKSDVSQCYESARRLAPVADEVKDSVVQAVIVPHAGYVFSGAVAASAFLRISADAHYDRIFLIGPSHHVAFDGGSVCNAFDAYRTPLGDVPVDTATCNALIQSDDVFKYVPAAHDREHCLEVELPFLQSRMKKMPPIVPIIIGTERLSTLESIAKGLRPYFNEHNLFVISSDFSHYPSADDAVKVDSTTGKSLLSCRLPDFIKALRTNASLGVPELVTSACGQSAIAVLLYLAQQNDSLKMQHVAYLNSSDSPYGDRKSVVGYHSFVLWRKVAQQSEGFTITEEDKRQLLNVAWDAISSPFRQKEVKPTKLFDVKCGVFVTLTELGRLRGCIGHFGEDVPLGVLTREMAHAAAFEDPRFSPLESDELPDITLEISVLTPLHRIYDISEFQYGKQGIYMRKGFQSGTYLPQVADEVNWTKEEFLGHCASEKAGIGWDGWRDAELYTYEAIRFEETFDKFINQ